MTDKNLKCAEAQMLIRKPIAKVFEAETGDELLAVIKRSTGGFTVLLDGLKAYMEHNINLNLIADKFPQEVFDHDLLRKMYGESVKE
jgi:hypothetical protein